MTALEEAAWLRRAIRHCEFWGINEPSTASLYAWRSRVTRVGRVNRLAQPPAGWLPAHIRYMGVSALRDRLRELEAAP